MAKKYHPENDPYTTLFVENLKKNGHATMIARGQSMSPTIKNGDRVILRQKRPYEPLPGQIALLFDKGNLILHRTVQYTTDGYIITIGDNLRSFDKPWPKEAVVGILDRIIREDGTVYNLDTPVERLKGLIRLCLMVWYNLLKRIYRIGTGLFLPT